MTMATLIKKEAFNWVLLSVSEIWFIIVTAGEKRWHTGRHGARKVAESSILIHWAWHGLLNP